MPRDPRLYIGAAFALVVGLLLTGATTAAETTAQRSGPVSAHAAVSHGAPGAVSAAVGRRAGELASTRRVVAGSRPADAATAPATAGRPASDTTLNSAVLRYDHDVSYGGSRQVANGIDG